jgi:hypothetical protein
MSISTNFTLLRHYIESIKTMISLEPTSQSA